MPLRLVHPAREGQDPPHRKGKKKRHKMPPLTPEESRHLRAAVRNMYKAFGSSWGCLAAVTNVSSIGLQDIASGRSPGSAAAALHVARAAGVSVECLLAGRVSDASTCPSCGQKMPRIASGGAS